MGIGRDLRELIVTGKGVHSYDYRGEEGTRGEETNIAHYSIFNRLWERMGSMRVGFGSGFWGDLGDGKERGEGAR